jgi:hypothetical protein
MPKNIVRSNRIAGHLFVGLAFTVALAYAQDEPAVRKGTTELGVFVGSSYGTDGFRVMGGGNVSYSVTKRILPYAEFSYFPGLPRVAQQLIGNSPLTVKYDLPLADYHVGVHVRVPVHEKPFVPYGVFGLGVVHNFQTNYKYDFIVNGVKQSQTVPLQSGNSFAVNFGGGVRYYINQKYGFRAEAKVYRAGGLIDAFFSKYEFGFFYQLH